MTDESRAAFEAWAGPNGISTAPGDGGYLWEKTRVSWLAWQASRKVALNEAIQLREAAQSVIDRWDTPAWKDSAPTAVSINALRAALAEPEPTGERDELIAKYPSCGPANILDAETLVEVALSVYSRALRYDTKVLHDRAMECRAELFRRLKAADMLEADGNRKPT